MKSCIFLLLNFAILFAATSSQSVSCEYADTTDGYTCLMTIDNPNGFDNFQSIAGTHLQGRTDNEVLAINIINGVTTVIPKILCNQFRSLLIVRANQRGIQVKCNKIGFLKLDYILKFNYSL